MKKKTGIIIAIVVVVVVAILAIVLFGGRRSVAINTSYETVAQNLRDAGYTVTLVTDTESLEQYGADGLVAAVIAYQGGEKMDTPDEDMLENYNMVELFYFENTDQAEAYYLTDDFQLGYQAWSDAYYHIGNKNFNYYFSENVAYAGLSDAINLCA